MPNTTLINKKKTILPLHFQIPNSTVLNSKHEGNVQPAALKMETNKYRVLPYVTSGVLISIAQLFDYGYISTFTSTHLTMHNKHI